MGSCYVIMQSIKASVFYNVNTSACAETGTSTLSDEDNTVYVTSLECMKAFPKVTESHQEWMHWFNSVIPEPRAEAKYWSGYFCHQKHDLSFHWGHEDN